VESSQVVPDCRETLQQLQGSWEECRGCDLGIYREAVGGAFVFGEGTAGTIMFIGEGPGKDEELLGRPFVGVSGMLLRDTIDELGLTQYYITNTVCCRSCAQQFDTEGNAQYTKQDGHRVPLIKDESPKGNQTKACFPRLIQEIYIVDPLLIVALGGTAASVILNRSVSIQAENGCMTHASLPGGAFIPALTPTGRWARKVRKQLIAPVAQNQVIYPVIPIVHPAFALRSDTDERVDAPMPLFKKGMEKVQQSYNRFVREVYGEFTDYGQTASPG